MTDSAKLLLRNLIQSNHEKNRGYQAALREIYEMENQNRRLHWLIRNGPKVFGTLWTEASIEDIDTAMRTPEWCEHQWIFNGRFGKKDNYKCLFCGKEEDR